MRRVLLAFVVCAAAWTVIAHAVTPADARHEMVAAGRSDTTSASPAGTDDPDRTWFAAARTHVSVTESLWKWSAVHADLAGERPGVVRDLTPSLVGHDRPDRDGPAHLTNIPLRI